MPSRSAHSRTAASLPRDQTKGPSSDPVKRAVLGEGVAGRDDVVDPEPLGERTDEVLGRRRREDDGAAGRPVLLDEGQREGVDHLGDGLGGAARGLVEGVTGSPLGHEGGLSREGDRGEGLADEVEGLVEQALAGEPAAHDPEVVHGAGEQLTRPALEEGAVEVEDRRTGHGSQATGRRASPRLPRLES